LEVFTGTGRRRTWTAEQKAQIVAESYVDGERVTAVAHRHGLTPQQLFGWRRQALRHALRKAEKSGPAFAPVVVEALRPAKDASIAPAESGGSHVIEIVIRRGHGSPCAGYRCREPAGGAARRDRSEMITVPAGIRVLVATKPVDFRRGADSLAALVREQLRHDPFSGTIFIFRSKRADRLKILAWDGSGLVLFWKRLEHGAFRWPPISDGVMRLSASQLAALVDGLDWARLHAPDIPRPTATS